MELLSKWFEKLFPKTSELEKFINSKNPNSAADVEHWTRRYYDSEARGL